MTDDDDAQDSVRSQGYKFWDAEIESGRSRHGAGWMGDIRFRVYINELITGSPYEWPMDFFQRFSKERVFPLALSIGCGTGALERDLLKRNICESVDAFDGSIVSLSAARQEAEAAGVGGRVRYFAADFNEITFPKGRYDVVFFHQSLHHVEQLEHLLRNVMQSLKRDGLLYLDEYVGPSASSWTYEGHEEYRALYKLVPEEWRKAAELELPIVEDDPSEAARSGEILRELRRGFDIQRYRPYGGNIISLFFDVIHIDRVPPEFIHTMIVHDRKRLLEGDQSFHAVVVATPKRGVRKCFASVDYLVRGRLRRTQSTMQFLQARVGHWLKRSRSEEKH